MLKNVLLEQFKACYNETTWFVCFQTAAADLTESHTLTAELVSSLFTRIEVFHDRHFNITFSFHDALDQEAQHG